MASIYERYKCSSPESHQPDLEYSDISGIGVSDAVISKLKLPADEYKVVVAFITVGFMVVLLSFLDYFLYFGLVPSPGVHQKPAKLGNQVDRAAVGPFQRALRTISPSLLEERRVKETHDALHAFVITISEAQTYTGIAILVSGVIALFNAALSEYHWDMVVLLAWSCHVTNVTAMTSFRSYLIDRPRKRYWLLVLMTFLIIMLVMATLPNGFWYGPRYNNSRPVHYAICAITPERMQEVWHAITHADTSEMESDEILDRVLSMIISLFIILVTFFTRAVKLSVRASRILCRIRRLCKAASIAILRKFDFMVSRVRPLVLRHYLIHGVQPSVLALLLSAELHHDFLTSMLSEVRLNTPISASSAADKRKLVFALSSIGWVTRRVDNIRYHRWTYGTQNQWTFGQILPVALLIYPFVSLAETILPLFVKKYTTASPSESEPHNDTSTDSPDDENHRPLSTTSGNKTPITLYLDHPSSFEQTWPWRSYVIYQYFYQVFLLAANLFVGRSDYSVSYLGKNFEAVFLLHPLTTYITILLHMQAEFIFKSWYPEDWSNQQRKAAVLHVSVCASVSVLFFGLNAWVNYQRIWLAWWIRGWHFPNFTDTFFVRDYFVRAFAWVSAYFITYHLVALGISLWMALRTTGDLGADAAEGVALEEQG